MSRHGRAVARARRGLTRRIVVTVVSVACAAAALVVLQVPGAEGGFIARTTDDANTVASDPYFACSTAVSDTVAGAAYLAYPLGEASGTAASDVSGNARTGLYQSTGVTYGVANSAVCPRDGKTVITLDGAAGYVSGPNTLVSNPTVFSIEAWFRTSAAQGKIIGFGSSRTGTSSNYDRHLYVDTNGKLEFGVYPSAVKTVASTATVTDGAWHYAAGTLSSAGMALYLDGTLVAKDTAVTTGQNFSGYWRIGDDTISGWTSAPSSGFFKGSLAWAAVYTYALTATQVAQHYAAGH